MAQGMVFEGMLHGLEDLGFTVEIQQIYYLFDLMRQMEFGFGEEFHIAVGRFSQDQEGIAVFKISAMGP